MKRGKGKEEHHMNSTHCSQQHPVCCLFFPFNILTKKNKPVL